MFSPEESIDPEMGPRKERSFEEGSKLHAGFDGRR